MLKFLRESRDEDTVCDIYLKKIIHHSDSPLELTPQKIQQQEDHHYHNHHHKKVKFFHREFIRKLFKIPKNSYNYSFNNKSNKYDDDDNNNNHIDKDEVDKESSLPPFPQALGNPSDIIGHGELSKPDSDAPSVQSEGRLKWSMREVRVLKYCTLKGLMRSLTAHDTGDMEPSVVHVFLATFRSYTTVEEVLQCLVERYAEVKKDLTMRNSIKENSLKNLKMVLLMWSYLYPSDFSESPPTNGEQGQDVTPTNSSSDDILTRHVKDDETRNGNDRLKMLTEFVESNLNDQDSVDKQLVNSIRALAANQNRAPPTPSLRLSCIRVPYVEGDDHPLLDHTGQCSSKVSDFDNFKPTVLAELLTHMDADLFLNVILHQCLGSVWGKRNRPGKGIPKSSSSSPLTPPSLSRSSSSSSSSSTVQATIEQFNALVYRVMTCILDESLTLDERAKVIERWVAVAQECRRLKNFSSLKAILSALQSSSVHRLSDTWSAVDRSYMTAFHNLAVLMSDVDNHKLCRDVLEKEGTGKSGSSEVTLKVNRKKQTHVNKLRIHKSHGDLSSSTSDLSPKKPLSTNDVYDVHCEGTVPFLGTFLTDLTMIDTAHKDYVEVADIDGSSDNDSDRVSTAGSDQSGDNVGCRRLDDSLDFADHRNCNSDKSVGCCARYINFSKKHKEWEVLVRMEILQKAASLYRVRADMGAYRWMEGLPIYRESDYYKMSLRLQDKASPPASISPTPLPATLTASASPTTKSTSTSSLLTSSRIFTSVVSLDSVSSSSSSSSSLQASTSSPFDKPSRLSTADDTGVVLLKFNNTRTTLL